MRRPLLGVGAPLAAACAAPPPGGDQLRFREVYAFQAVVVVDEAESRRMRFGDVPEALNQSCRRHDRSEHLAFDYTRAMTAALLCNRSHAGCC